MHKWFLCTLCNKTIPTNNISQNLPKINNKPKYIVVICTLCGLFMISRANNRCINSQQSRISYSFNHKSNNLSTLVTCQQRKKKVCELIWIKNQKKEGEKKGFTFYVSPILAQGALCVLSWRDGEHGATQMAEREIASPRISHRKNKFSWKNSVEEQNFCVLQKRTDKVAIYVVLYRETG